MKKVLIITYYWPPSGGAGVQRWLKFTKYLRNYGWEPVIYTPENPESPVVDDSLEKDIPEGIKVIKRPIWEPYDFYKRFVGVKRDSKINSGFLTESEKPRFSENLSVWIRGNLFIPDARRFWIKPSVKFLSSYLRENPVDAIVSTGPPHSMHMIALKLKEKLGIPWLADFRDPWTNIDFYDELKLSFFADKKHHKLEKEVLKISDAFVTVSWNWAKDFKEIYNRKIEVITNGFDEDDFAGDDKELSVDEKFSIVHIGAMNKDRNPENFWLAIKELISEIPELESLIAIKLIGSTDVSVFNSVNKLELGNYVERVKSVPHDKVISYTKSAQVLLLALNNTPNVSGIIPGKLFEYIAARRPILCIGPEDGDSARILKESSSGKVANFSDKSKIKDIIKLYFEDYLRNDLTLNKIDINKYSRKYLCGKIADLLNNIKKG